jgi:hypothetical protein
MKWIKHDADANQDAKLQNVLLDYGLEGYGLYWYCIELIAGKVDKDNITFELEHDARIIARNVGSTPEKVEQMMKYFVKTGLFESSDGVITCLKMARRLDQSMTSNKQMREIIDNFKRHDAVMIESERPMQDKIRLDQTRVDKDKSIEQNALLEEGFEIFYTAGLVKKSKLAAFKTFKSLCKAGKFEPSEFGEMLANDVKQRIALGQFGIDKLHPSTYLNQHRWTDEKTNDGIAQATGKQSAAERITARNNAKYGQPSGGLGLAEGRGDLRGTMDQGERGITFDDVGSCIEQNDTSGGENWDQSNY